MQFLGQAIGRFLLAFIFLFSGARKILGYQSTLAYMQSKGVFPAMDIAGYPLVEVLLMATIALEIVGGLMLITGIGSRLAVNQVAVLVAEHLDPDAIVSEGLGIGGAEGHVIAKVRFPRGIGCCELHWGVQNDRRRVG